MRDKIICARLTDQLYDLHLCFYAQLEAHAIQNEQWSLTLISKDPVAL